MRFLGTRVVLAAVAVTFAVGAVASSRAAWSGAEGPLDRDGAGPSNLTWTRPGEPIGVALMLPADRLPRQATFISAGPLHASGIRYVGAVVTNGVFGGATPFPVPPADHPRTLAGASVRPGQRFDVVVGIARTGQGPGRVSDWELRYRIGPRVYTSHYGMRITLAPTKRGA